MSTHYICFCGEIRKIIMWIPLLFGDTSPCVDICPDKNNSKIIMIE